MKQEKYFGNEKNMFRKNETRKYFERMKREKHTRTIFFDKRERRKNEKKNSRFELIFLRNSKQLLTKVNNRLDWHQLPQL